VNHTAADNCYCGCQVAEYSITGYTDDILD